MAKKKTKSKSSKSDDKQTLPKDSPLDPNLDAIAAAICSANSSVFLKVCRLCESKDGPFLNIFDTEKITSKKVEELMPFGIAENDGLPHKICFRCSAKVEELYDFIQKCIKTQKSLHNAMGKGPLLNKPKTRILWEEKLNKSNMSNDDICDALIKKAMEGIKDIPRNSNLPEDAISPPSTLKNDSKQPTHISNKTANDSTTASPILKTETRKIKKEIEDLDVPLKDLKIPDENKFIPIRTSRSKNTSENLLDGLPDYKRKKVTSKQNETNSAQESESCGSSKNNKGINDFSFDYDDGGSNSNKQTVVSKQKPPSINPTPFNIMDHISTIKVNGVGVLFQCKLCNRNFLKQEIVMSHGCAKTGVPKADFTKKIVPPEPPKLPAVKYIKTNIEDDVKKPPIENKSDIGTVKSVENLKKETQKEVRIKPKIGPASRVGRNNCKSVVGMTVMPIGSSSHTKPMALTQPPPPANNQATSAPNEVPVPTVNFPTIPSLNSRYKLVPGPNNTFQLVEEAPETTEVVVPEVINTTTTEINPTPGVKRKSIAPKTQEPKIRKQYSGSKTRVSHEIIDLETDTSTSSKLNSQPYPVGLFQTMPHHSIEAPFTTPAMKKQSYTVVQTGNPSKLLISSKPQKPVTEEVVPKKRTKKTKAESKAEVVEKQPFSVTLEDAAPPKDSGFFTFINVDPLLQPSYVLPTDNIIQESQISTSTQVSKSNTDGKDNYSCNMCGEKFSREKKLLTHIQSHYTKMDEEDQLRSNKSTKKKSGKKH